MWLEVTAGVGRNGKREKGREGEGGRAGGWGKRGT